MVDFISDKIEYHIGRDEAEKFRRVDESLRARPAVSVRLRIVVGFLLCFLLTGATALTSLAILYHARSRVRFLSTDERVAELINETRPPSKGKRWPEKNLRNAVRTKDEAMEVFRSGTVEMLDTLGQNNLNALTNQVSKYGSLMDQRLLIENGGPEEEPLKDELDKAILRQGDRVLLALARNGAAVTTGLDRTLKAAQVVPFVFLFLLLLLILWIAYLLATTITGTISRFQEYTRRIAAGDFSPIGPAKRYQDEFSELARATNRMLYELRAREAQVVQSGKMATIGSFTSGIVHELSNPLNNILLTADTLLESCKNVQERQKAQMVEEIQAEAERAAETVRALAEFVHTSPSKPDSLSLREILKSSARLLENEMELGRVTLRLDVPPDFPRILGEPNQLRQVFLNLLLNGIQAMPEGGELTVRAKRLDEQHVCVEVADDGVGIPPEDIPRILDPFFTTKPKDRAAGLGLTISYAVLKKYGGDMRVQSIPGKGTTVYVRLPEATVEEPEE